jgi:hypothetical protein
VSDAAGERPEEARFVLAAPPPLRSLAISSVAALIAAAMIVLGNALDLPRAAAIAGIGVMIFAIVLAALALILTVRLRTTLIFGSAIDHDRPRPPSQYPALVHDRQRQDPRSSLGIDH